MENKFLTLQKIYDRVKNNSHPALCMVQTSELIPRQNFPWNEVVNHLNEFQAEGFVNIKQFSTAAISITEEGLQYITSFIPAIEFNSFT